MKVLSVARKTLKELLRNRRTLLLTLGFPIAFMLIFGFAFRDAGTTTYDVAVVNDDTGAMGAQYVSGLANLTYENGKHMLAIHNASLDDAKEQLKLRNVFLIVHVPANFTAGLTPPTQGASTNPAIPTQVTGGGQAAPPAQPTGTRIDLTIDPGSGGSQAASAIVSAYTNAFASAAARQQPLVVTNVGTITSASLSSFDFIAPGLFVYAILNLAPQAAALLAQESEKRTLDRLKLSRLSSPELLLGVSLAQFAMAAISLTLTFVTARLLGFHPQGSVPLAVGLALVAAAASIGIGMIIAAFAKTRDDAANIAVFIVVPASFLSGAFFPIPSIDLFNVAGHKIGVYDFLPSSHAVKALRSILTLGQGAADVTFQVEALVVLSALYFAVGATLFARRRMRLTT